LVEHGGSAEKIPEEIQRMCTGSRRLAISLPL
jgi:hypothetical protein